MNEDQIKKLLASQESRELPENFTSLVMQEIESQEILDPRLSTSSKLKRSLKASAYFLLLSTLGLLLYGKIKLDFVNLPTEESGTGLYIISIAVLVLGIDQLFKLALTLKKDDPV